MSSSLYSQGSGTTPGRSFQGTPLQFNRDPTTSDIQGTSGLYQVGQSWINTSTDTSWQLVGFSSSLGAVTATWIVTGGSTSSLSTLSGDTGTANPVGSNINILGSGPISTLGSGDDITISFSGSTFAVETLTGNTGSAVVPSSGNINVVGSGSLAFSGSASNLTGAITPGSNLVASLASDSGTATPSSGVITIAGGAGLTTSATGSTLTVGLTGGGAAIDSLAPNSGTNPVVPDAAGLVTLIGTGSITTVGGTNSLTAQLTGLTNHNLLVGAGTATITNVAPGATPGVPLITIGAASDPTFGTALVVGGGTGATSFTTYGPVVAGATATTSLSSVAPSATSGVPFISQGASANPAFGTAVVAGGGTGIVTTTAYGVLCGGTTATGNFQNAGAGTSGEVLLSNGASALPSFQSGSGLGGLKFVSSQTASTSASIVFNNLSGTIDTYLVTMTFVVPVTNTAFLQMDISNDNGSTFLNSGYISGILYSPYNSTVTTNSNSTATFILTGPSSNVGTNDINGSVTLWNANDGNSFHVTGDSTWSDTTIGTTAGGSFFGKAGTGINAIRFIFSSGNISTGTFTLFSYATS